MTETRLFGKSMKMPTNGSLHL